MRRYWTNLILHASAKNFDIKRRIASSTSGKSIIYVFAVIFLEIFIAFISFPLYMVSRGEFSANKNQFRIRKIFSITFLFVVLAIWLLKLILIIGMPVYFDSKQYIITQDSQSYETVSDKSFDLPLFYNAKLDQKIPVPVIKNIIVTDGREVIAEGFSKGSTKTVIHIGSYEKIAEASGNSLKSFVVDNDEHGYWNIRTSPNHFTFNPGNYWIQTTAYEDETAIRSQAGPMNDFEIKQGTYERIAGVLDKYLNYFIIAFIAVGIFSIIILI